MTMEMSGSPKEVFGDIVVSHVDFLGMTRVPARLGFDNDFKNPLPSASWIETLALD